MFVNLEKLGELKYTHTHTHTLTHFHVYTHKHARNNLHRVDDLLTLLKIIKHTQPYCGIHTKVHACMSIFDTGLHALFATTAWFPTEVLWILQKSLKKKYEGNVSNKIICLRFSIRKKDISTISITTKKHIRPQQHVMGEHIITFFPYPFIISMTQWLWPVLHCFWASITIWRFLLNFLIKRILLNHQKKNLKINVTEWEEW